MSYHGSTPFTWVQFHFVGILKSETMFSFQCFVLEWILGRFASSSKNTTQSVDQYMGLYQKSFFNVIPANAGIP